MSLFILTEENLADAKSALRAFLPDVRSAHLTEAIAAGLGFRTHAALRAALASDAGFQPATADASGAVFNERLVVLGYPGDAADAFIVSTSEPMLSDTPYVLFKRCDRESNDRHYDACQHRNRPMLMIKTARRYAELEWDCITIHPDQEGYLYGTDEGQSLTEAMIARFQMRIHGMTGRARFRGRAFTGRVEHLLPETARLLAEDYFRLLYLPLRKPQGPRQQAA